jgi:hypothetical protein
MGAIQTGCGVGILRLRMTNREGGVAVAPHRRGSRMPGFFGTAEAVPYPVVCSLYFAELRSAGQPLRLRSGQATGGGVDNT